MLIAKKIRLIPTSEQEILFWKSAGVARWAYNYFLSEQETVYKEYVKNELIRQIPNILENAKYLKQTVHEGKKSEIFEIKFNSIGKRFSQTIFIKSFKSKLPLSRKLNSLVSITK